MAEKQRELDRQRNRLFAHTVVRRHPFGDFGTESRLKREFRQAGLDVTRSRCRVSGEYVAPVSLRVDKKLFLSELHERIPDGSVAVGMIFHRLTDDSGHLVETSVVGGLHGMEYAPLHRLKSVFDVRHGTFKNHITCILKIPVAEHAGKQRAPVPFAGNIVFRHSHNGNCGICNGFRFYILLSKRRFCILRAVVGIFVRKPVHIQCIVDFTHKPFGIRA